MRLKRSLVLMGLKHSGKSTLGILAAKRWNAAFRDLDNLLLHLAMKDMDPPPENCRELYRRNSGLFQKYEAQAAAEAAEMMNRRSLVLSLGGGAVENSAVTILLRELAGKDLLLRVYLMEEEEVLFGRISAGGIPPFLEGPDPRRIWRDLYQKRHNLYSAEADITLSLSGANPAEALELLEEALAVH